MTSLKLLSLNLHMGFTHLRRRFVLPELREAIRDTGADLVFLQEVVGEHQLHSERHAGWPEAGQYEYLADSIWPEFAYGQNAAYPHGHHGNALLSRFPIRAQQNHDISHHRAEKRGLLHVVLDAPGTRHDVHAICVHFGLDERQRRAQVRKLVAFVHNTVPADAPLLVAGDFNDWRGRLHAPLREELDLAEAFVDLTGKAARTFPAWLPFLRLDRVYSRNCRTGAAVVLTRRPWSRLSDHVPLCVEVEF